MKNKRRTFAAVAATAIATSVLALGAAGAASASPVQPRWFSTIGECQTYGNQLAQQGRLLGFNCVAAEGGYLFYKW
ncbi:MULTISPECIES: hypothetical protein [Streptomyces]|uniref:Secreted protein n=1 Tax=Streptomyces lonegramiae TaxID=3075524 RepID=A0ABU2X5K5_9ACTN|nr:hypothetical protein [Streptomyces sp. DSM 41529]MDT0541189.1 hypothetical protein [Streptomyces sp. DSM 41529]